MKAANQAIRALDTDTITAYERERGITLEIDGEAIAFGPEDLEVTSEGIEGHLVGQEGPVTVALDTTLTDELRKEGLAREFVNRVQNLRKSAGFEVSDRIIVTFGASPSLGEAIDQHDAVIRNETLAEALTATASPEGEAVRAFEIGDESVEIGVQRTTSETVEQ
jgi:isoleucyl-tRNA synthetase